MPSLDVKEILMEEAGDVTLGLQRGTVIYISRKQNSNILDSFGDRWVVGVYSHIA